MSSTDKTPTMYGKQSHLVKAAHKLRAHCVSLLHPITILIASSCMPLITALLITVALRFAAGRFTERDVSFYGLSSDVRRITRDALRALGNMIFKLVSHCRQIARKPFLLVAREWS